MRGLAESGTERRWKWNSERQASRAACSSRTRDWYSAASKSRPWHSRRNVSSWRSCGTRKWY